MQCGAHDHPRGGGPSLSRRCLVCGGAAALTTPPLASAAQTALPLPAPFGPLDPAPTPYAVSARRGAHLKVRSPMDAHASAALVREIDLETGAVAARGAHGIRLPEAPRLSALAALDAATARTAAPVVRQALERQADAVRSLAPAAEPGLASLPAGAAYYARCLALHLGAPCDPHDAHAEALQVIRRLNARADALLRSQRLTTGSVAERLRLLAADPMHLFADDDEGRDQAVQSMNSALARLRPAVTRAFSAPPEAKLQVLRMTSRDEASGRAGYRDTAAGAYYVDLSAIRARPRWTLASVAYHEVSPGHLMQQAYETPGANPTGAAYYAEAWATYAEQLAADLGAYVQDPLEEIGSLYWRLFRLARVVVDTGVHAKRWPFDRALQVMSDIQGFPAAFIGFKEDLERICVFPGQAAAQGIGAIRLSRLRGMSALPILAFHAGLLRSGPAPLMQIAAATR